MAMNNILGLFAHSPLKPLQNTLKKVTECSDLLIPFFSNYFLKELGTSGRKTLRNFSM